MNSQKFLKSLIPHKTNIKFWIENGWTNLAIANELGIDHYADKILLYHMIYMIKNPTQTIFGSKTEPYYPKEDFDIPEYKWEQLSKEEKLFYKNFKNK